jgi:hypothetical protein
MKILPVVLIALVASKAWSSDYAVPPENAVSWWRAENNAHDSLDGNNGTLINGAAFATGKIGQAFYFDGTSQYVEIGNSSNLNPASSFSIEGWICSRQDTPQEIMSKWTDSPAQPNQRSFNFFVYFDRSLGFAISDAAHQWDSNFHFISSPPFLPWLDISISQVKVTQHVMLGHKYVLESSMGFDNWTPVGNPFTATNEVVSEVFNVDTTGRYFRIREVN